MYLKELELINFRNYDFLNVEFNRNINLISGRNGQGKTNIVEAIYMLSLARSFRTNRDSHLIKFQKDNLYIRGIFKAKNIDRKIELSIGKGKKGIRLNGLSLSKRSDLLGNFYCVIFSPEDLRLVKDGPAERRKFLDKEISQILPQYYVKLSQYNKILSNRNKYLKAFQVDEQLLDVYDYKLAQLGSYIFKKRKEYIREISIISGGLHKKISNSAEELNLSYKTQLEFADNTDDEDMEKRYYQTLIKERQRDMKMKNTSLGIHKDDLDLYINGVDLKQFGSQGQQRTASIALKLSEIDLIYKKTGEYPILILDDVFSELDDKRQELLVKTLKNVQMFITSAEDLDKEVFNTDETSRFYIESGQIVSIRNGGR